VTWLPFAAPQATISTDRFPETPIADTGTYALPGSAITASPGQTRDDRVRLKRGLRAAVAGACPGSSVQIDVRNVVLFVVDAT